MPLLRAPRYAGSTVPCAGRCSTPWQALGVTRARPSSRAPMAARAATRTSKQLLGGKVKEGLLAGYTALYIFVRGEDGTFDAPIAADQSHLQGAAEMGLPHVASTEPLSGPNDSKEQV